VIAPLQIRVGAGDVDFSGFVHHAAHLRFMERARTELLRELGLEQRALAETEGILLVVRAMRIDIPGLARLDEELEVKTTVAGLGAATLELEQKIFRGREPIVDARATVAVVCNGRPRRLPVELRETFERVAGEWAAKT